MAGGDLEQNNGGRVALGGRIVLAARAEERIQVRASTGLDVRRGCLGQGEIEQDQVLGTVVSAGAFFADAEVGRFDVAMHHAGVVERDDRFQELGTPAVEEVKGEPFPIAQVSSQGFGAGAGQDEGAASADVEGTLEETHDPRAVELAQGIGFVVETTGGGVVSGNLKNTLRAVVGGQVGDQEADGR